MSVLDKISQGSGIEIFINEEDAWADFFITRVGLILFAAVLLLAVFKVHPMFQEIETRAYMDAVASDIASKIEAVDSTTIPGYRYIYVFDGKIKNINVEISAEYVVARANLSTGGWGERELIHAEPVITYVYPPNSRWSNTSGLRKYLSENSNGSRNGDITSPLNFSADKGNVEEMFNHTRSELSRAPFTPDLNKPLILEKVIIYYNTQKGMVEKDYVLVYQ